MRDGMRAKLATSVIGAVATIEAGLLLPEYDPLPLPVQPLKLYPFEGVALRFTGVPLSNQSLAGLTFPPAPALIVTKYLVVKFAVYVAEEFGVMACDIAPPSLQEFHACKTPVPPLCGELTAIVCGEPAVQLKICAEA